MRVRRNVPLLLCTVNERCAAVEKRTDKFWAIHVGPFCHALSTLTVAIFLQGHSPRLALRMALL